MRGFIQTYSFMFPPKERMPENFSFFFFALGPECEFSFVHTHRSWTPVCNKFSNPHSYLKVEDTPNKQTKNLALACWLAVPLWGQLHRKALVSLATLVSSVPVRGSHWGQSPAGAQPANPARTWSLLMDDWQESRKDNAAFSKILKRNRVL